MIIMHSNLTDFIDVRYILRSGYTGYARYISHFEAVGWAREAGLCLGFQTLEWNYWKTLFGNLSNEKI